MKITRQLSFSTITIEMKRIGIDIQVLVSGGEEHIGSVVLALPRESLKKDGSISCTSSVLNVVGHKDEFLCRTLAESICKKKNTTVVCMGGFHVDDITPIQIQEVLDELNKIIENL